MNGVSCAYSLVRLRISLGSTLCAYSRDHLVFRSRIEDIVERRVVCVLLGYRWAERCVRTLGTLWSFDLRSRISLNVPPWRTPVVGGYRWSHRRMRTLGTLWSFDLRSRISLGGVTCAYSTGSVRIMSEKSRFLFFFYFLEIPPFD